ncbi:hypothetical protein PAHAL_9G128700 [Panicum hallii]|jgi:hypothetical protein|uniref:Uncharacterized protein n=1 Tax=Panicum hallii TaxID=206008 RepID=A0A2S3IJN8_9POAL|nr:actin cytoskeleton-regulatory complex protein pan1-like [Panicum hallii]PAN45580.1 hypothetical protein PAHAL_9G128700 [Panicum hallii]
MDAAPGAKPTRREPPPLPPNYVSLRHLQELRLKEKEEQERRRREEEEEAAARREAEKAAAARREAKNAAAARREAKKAAAARREAEKAAAIKREAALKEEAKGRAVSWEASGGDKERHRGGGQVQGQGHQWIAVAHRAPVTSPWPMGRRQGAAGKNEAAIGGGRGKKGPDDSIPDNAPHGGGKHRVKGKWKGTGKEKLADALPASSQGGKPAEVVPQPLHGGKPESKSESKAKGKGPGDQAAESSSSDVPGEPADAAILSSRGRFQRGRPTGAGGRSAETCAGIAPEKAAGPSPPRGVKSDDMGKPKPSAARRADAMAGSNSPDGKKAAPAQAPCPSVTDGSSKPTSDGELRNTMEAKPGGLVEGQRRRQVAVVQAVAELNPRGARCSAGPWRGRGNEATEQHGRVWVPKAAAAGSSAGAEL